MTIARAAPRACIVGVGPGAPEWLTERARAAIAACDAVLAWELNLLPLGGLLEGKRLFVQHPDDYARVAEAAATAMRTTGGSIAIVRIGDALVSSGLTGLLALFHDFDIEVVPGVGSAQLAASLARINLDEAVLVSFHEERRWEQERAFMHDAFRRGRHLVVLTGPEGTPNETAAYLVAKGVDPQTEALVAERLALPGERVVRSTLASVAGTEFDWLSVLVVVHPTGINPHWQHRPSGGEGNP